LSELDWSRMAEMVKRSEWFDVSNDDFAMLEIQSANDQFSYFYNTSRRSLVKHFLLGESAQVALLCEIRLAVKGARFSPRVRLTRVHKPKLSDPGIEEVLTNTVALKASVSTDGGHENFMKLMAFVLSIKEVNADIDSFRMTTPTDEEILHLVRGRSRDETVSLVRSLLESSVSEEEIALINNRKGQIAYFEKLLVDQGFFESERQRLSKTPEALWQDFFEKATWIFGYGLSLVGHESMASGKLEQITTGANI
jgi:hypothetical protein